MTTAARTLPSPSFARDDASWWRQAAVYQVYPRSFADANGDGLGDIAGITSRVPYLVELGIDAVWLSPFYPSALADGGYDVADYRNVDPRLGTLADFDAMLAALHAEGIHVVVDIVPNHTSDQHEWFQEALSGRTRVGSARSLHLPGRKGARRVGAPHGLGVVLRGLGVGAGRGRPVVPALLRGRAARPQLVASRGARRLRAHAPVLVGSRRRRIPHRRRPHADEGSDRTSADAGSAERPAP